MLFNTPEFILLFLPVAVVLHFALARISPHAAVIGTALSSLVFYAWWNPPFVALPVASIAANYVLARRMAAVDQAAARRVLIAGIVANLLVLSYFKYYDFFLSIIDGHKAVPPRVPLALSFTTFVQIAFLVDAYRRRKAPDAGRYAMFVAFFPHLIAGPIVRWNSLGRQLADPSRYRVDWNNMALGLTIFTFGLIKKVLISDPLAPHVAGVFDAAAGGAPVTAFAAWAACFGFAAQVYFDFSGYSDMAVGLGLLFNLRLPVNFAAPLRATSLFDLWRRWHITLSQFLRDFVYIPLGGNRCGPARQAFNLFIAMVLAGFWHGAGWTYVAWGTYHGALLVGTFVWQAWRGPGGAGPVARFAGWVWTFTAFTVGLAFIRAADIATSGRLLTAMSGFGNAAAGGHTMLDWDEWLLRHDYVSPAFVQAWLGNTWSVLGTILTAAAIAIMLLVPDTMEIVDYRESDAQSDWRRKLGILHWRPSLIWLGVTSAWFVVAFTSISRVSEFFYYQF
jgi:alginate O-acetyltransferase complex protein AlgI